MELEALGYDCGPTVSDKDVHDAILGGVAVTSPAVARALAPKDILDRFEDSPMYGRLLLTRLGNVTFEDGGQNA